MKTFKEISEATLHDKIKNHPAVQHYETNHGEHFVNLKPGYEWSGQRAFGDETAGKVWKLLKGVTKSTIKEDLNADKRKEIDDVKDELHKTKDTFYDVEKRHNLRKNDRVLVAQIDTNRPHETDYRMYHNTDFFGKKSTIVSKRNTKVHGNESTVYHTAHFIPGKHLDPSHLKRISHSEK